MAKASEILFGFIPPLIANNPEPCNDNIRTQRIENQNAKNVHVRIVLREGNENDIAVYANQRLSRCSRGTDKENSSNAPKIVYNLNYVNKGIFKQ